MPRVKGYSKTHQLRAAAIVLLFFTLLSAWAPVHSKPKTQLSLPRSIVHDKAAPLTIQKELQFDNIKLLLEKNFEGEETYQCRKGTSLNVDELKYLSLRLPRITQHIAPLTNNDPSPNHTPIITALGSGGGYRAMIGYLGFLEGLEELKLLDALAYLTGVSGSTWLLASLFAHQKSPQEHHDFLQQQTQKKFAMSKNDLLFVGEAIRNKISYRQKLTFCDLWGGMISNAIFAGKEAGGQDERLENLIPLVATGATPYPIFTGVIDGLSSYEWMEFTPYEIGSEFLETWIPSNCFGKKFNAGISNDSRPGATLSYLVGLFGSAYACTFPELIKYLHTIMIEIFKPPTIGRKFYLPLEFFENLRFSPPMIRNITRGIKKAPLADDPYTVIVDAGLDFNLPFPPVMRRKSNLILCCDMSASVKLGEKFNELRKTEAYMKRKGIPFPRIDYAHIESKKISIFMDKDNPALPIILYFPNQVDFPTSKFEYSKEEFEELAGTMKKTIVESADIIYEAINTAHERQKKCHQLQQSSYVTKK